MALSKEQARAFYERAVEAGYSDDEIVAELKKRNSPNQAAPAAPVQAVAPVETVVEEPAGIKVPISDPNKNLEKLMGGNAFERFLGGVSRGIEGVDRGGRKLISQAIGDDEGVRRYEDQETRAREIMEQYDPTGAGPSMADSGKTVADIVQALAMGGGAKGLLAGVGAGAGYGALQPTVEGESQGFNAALGAGGAAAGQLVGRGYGAFRDALRKLDVPEALEDFTSRTMGVGRNTSKGPMYEGITDAVEAERARLKDALSRRYSNVEGAASQPVEMAATSRLSDEALSLPEEVMNSLNPGAQRTMAALRRGSTHVSPIVDQGGTQIQMPRNVSFVDVRDTVRQLRTAKRAMPHTDAGVARSQQIDNLINRLDQDLESWGRSGPEMGPNNADILRGARQTDADYAAQVAPFGDRNTTIGQLTRSAADEGAIDRLFLGDNKGQAMEELLTRVPGALHSARGLYGSKLLKERGDTSAIRQLEGGTTAEQLLTRPEREYTNALAANLREHKGANVDVGRLIRSLLHAPVIEAMGGKRIDKGLTGILPYGTRELDTTMLQQLLRAYGATQSGE